MIILRRVHRHWWGCGDGWGILSGFYCLRSTFTLISILLYTPELLWQTTARWSLNTSRSIFIWYFYIDEAFSTPTTVLFRESYGLLWVDEIIILNVLYFRYNFIRYSIAPIIIIKIIIISLFALSVNIEFLLYENFPFLCYFIRSKMPNQ